MPEALDWIESEMQVMLDMQQPDGHIEYWYGEGNFNRTGMLYALMQSQGVRPEHWKPGVAWAPSRRRRLHSCLQHARRRRRIRFDYARHRRVLNLDRNYVRLNEFPEWFTVDEITCTGSETPARPNASCSVQSSSPASSCSKGNGLSNRFNRQLPLSRTRGFVTARLFDPFPIRSLTLRNRIVVSPMCQYP